jgi:hypothetical protein
MRLDALAGGPRTTRPAYAGRPASGRRYVRSIVVQSARSDETLTQTKPETSSPIDAEQNGTPEPVAAVSADNTDSTQKADEQPAHLSWELDVDALGALDYKEQTSE